jgi:hypothetical protein
MAYRSRVAASERRRPEIFCWVFGGRKSRSAWFALELAVRLVVGPVSAVAGAAHRHPLAALGIAAVIALVTHQAGYLKRDRLRAAGQEISRVAARGIEAFGNATDAYGKARRALRVIEPYGTPTLEELAARHLARVRRPLPFDELAAALEAGGYAVTSAELRDATGRHPAFRTRLSQPSPPCLRQAPFQHRP